jgi:hypothetical protein
MRYIFSLTVLVLNCFPGNAHINGVILDSITKIPVGFSTITYQGQMRGAITNGEGQFVLEGNGSSVDTMLISHLGIAPGFSRVVEQKDTIQARGLTKTLCLLCDALCNVWGHRFTRRNHRVPQRKIKPAGAYSGYLPI